MTRFGHPEDGAGVGVAVGSVGVGAGGRGNDLRRWDEHRIAREVVVDDRREGE